MCCGKAATRHPNSRAYRHVLRQSRNSSSQLASLPPCAAAKPQLVIPTRELTAMCCGIAVTRHPNSLSRYLSAFCVDGSPRVYYSSRS